MAKKTKTTDFSSKVLAAKSVTELVALAGELRATQLTNALALGASKPLQNREIRRNRARVLTALHSVAQQ